MTNPSIGDLCHIRFCTRHGCMATGKGILLAKVGINCLFLLVFYPDHGEQRNAINVLELAEPTKAANRTRVGYSEINHGNVIENTVNEVETVVSRVCLEALQEALDDILDTTQRNILLGYLAPEKRVISTVYEKYVGQKGVRVPGLCDHAEEGG